MSLTPEEIEAKAVEERKRLEAVERLAALDPEQADVVRASAVEVPLEDLEQLIYLAELGKRIDAGPGDTLAVRLLDPVKVGDGQRSTLGVRPVKVRDVRAARRAIREGESELAAYADEIVEPKGAHLEIGGNDDWQAVLLAVDRQLGKFLGTGRVS